MSDFSPADYAKLKACTVEVISEAKGADNVAIITAGNQKVIQDVIASKDDSLHAEILLPVNNPAGHVNVNLEIQVTQAGQFGDVKAENASNLSSITSSKHATNNLPGNVMAATNAEIDARATIQKIDSCMKQKSFPTQRWQVKP
jgi:hypothetical protein